MAQDFAVILLDVRMPIMDGFETAALIRQRQQSEMTPIIFITAHGSDEIADADRYAEGAVDFIFAPCHPDELRAKVSVFANLFIKAEAARRAGPRACRRRPTSCGCSPTPRRSASSRPTPTNRYVYTNPRWSEITGIPPEEAVGQRVGHDHRRRAARRRWSAELADGDVDHGRAQPPLRDRRSRARRRGSCS